MKLIFCYCRGVGDMATKRYRRGMAPKRQRGNEKLRESELRLRLALEGGDMGMWEWRIGSNQTKWDNKKYELHGLPIGDGHLSTEVASSNLHPDDAPAYKRALADSITQRSTFFQEFRIIRPDGEVRWLAEKGRLFHDEDGNPSIMVGVCFDVTSRKLAEEDLRAQRDELAAFMDTVPAITFVTHDTECNLLICNEKARQFLRLPNGDNPPTSMAERLKICRPMREGRELAPEEFPLRIAATGQAVRDFELTMLFNDGTSRDILGDAVPLFDVNGTVRGAVAAFLDITERKKTQMELQNAHADLESRVEERTAELSRAIEALSKETEERIQALDALRQSTQLLIQQSRLAAMGEMISNIAHQWRQPLNLLGLIIQELPIIYEKGEFNEVYLRTMVNKAMYIVSHMSQTIEDFRYFFKPDREKVAFKVKDAVTKALSIVEESFKIMEITINIEAIGDPVIFGYPSEFSQALLNLFLNSRDAFLEGRVEKRRTISVRMFSENDKTVVAVTDNAGGISEEIIGKIFEPYFTTKGPDKGTGIGLFMTKTIIEQHMNGKIFVQNIDDGVEFRIELYSGSIT
jgi:PAS domain S-box-containing protein